MQVLINGVEYFAEGIVLDEKTKAGCKCPECGDSWNNKTLDSRTDDDGLRIRRRKCESCGARWKTAEVAI